MSEINTCCSSGCDLIKAIADQKRVVDTFDKLDDQVKHFDSDKAAESIVEMERTFEQLKSAIFYLREKK